MPRLEVSTLTGRHVILRPLSLDDVDAIASASSGDRSTFAYTTVPDGADAARRYVTWLLDDAAAMRVAPFVQVRRSDGAVVGCTRYLEPRWPLGRDDPDEVEVGGTWLAPEAQRSPINTEAKLLLLTHAFEVWNVQRVAICTDALNERSRRAIERIGATLEGVLRRHRPSTLPESAGTLRDTAVYSIVAPDWPPLADRLRSLVTS